ncbi:QRFP-like peptide receptor [Babylonia areolata]|uniref:QRFP-like peptide receptor n=1 Tax=Babylonia areolata TaxID=304850 RepID=UPI003FD32789
MAGSVGSPESCISAVHRGVTVRPPIRGNPAPIAGLEELEDLYYDPGSMLTSHTVETVALVAVYVPIFLLAVLGNVFVLVVVLMDTRMRKSAPNYFLCNLAIADLLVALFCIPITAARYVYQVWVFGEIMCKATGYLQGISIVASVLTLLCMAFDRYFAIRHPMRNRQIFTVRRVRQLIGVIWLLAAVLVIPLLVIRKVETYDIGLQQLALNSVSVAMDVPNVHIQYCTEAWPSSLSRNVYDVVFLCLVYVLPGSLTVFLYTRIGTTLWAKDQALSRQNSYVANESKMVLTRRRLALMMVILSLLFAACWLPYYIINLCINFGPSTSSDLISLYPFTVLLGHSNSAQNPVLYCLMHRGFQQIVLRMMRCQCRRLFRKNTLTRMQTERTQLQGSVHTSQHSVRRLHRLSSADHQINAV